MQRRQAVGAKNISEVPERVTVFPRRRRDPPTPFQKPAQVSSETAEQGIRWGIQNQVQTPPVIPGNDQMTARLDYASNLAHQRIKGRYPFGNS
jgi:hypothetical protein